MAWFSDARAPLSPETRALLLARACARRGFAAAARALHAGLPPEYGSRQTIASHRRFGRDLRNRRILDHADPTLPWQDLLARHDRTIPLLRGGERTSAQAARDRIAARLEREPTGAGDQGADADRLLRALSGQAAPVRPKFDAEPLPPRAPLADYGDDPSDRVVTLGLEAVPDLIGLLRDDTPTRSVWYSTKYGGHFSVESVRDIARACLQRIAGGRPKHQNEQEGWVEWYAAARDRGLETARVEVLGLRPDAKNVAEHQAAYVRERYGWQR